MVLYAFIISHVYLYADLVHLCVGMECEAHVRCYLQTIVMLYQSLKQALSAFPHNFLFNSFFYLFMMRSDFCWL